jgi:hypothetical protein
MPSKLITIGSIDTSLVDQISCISTRWKFISSGPYWTILVSQDNQVFAVGTYNNSGQMGVGYHYTPPIQPCKVPLRINPSDNITHVSCGYNFSVIVLNNTQILTAGDNSQGQLSHSFSDNTIFNQCIVPYIVVDRISCGSLHTVILSHNGELYTVGYNRFRQCSSDPANSIDRFTLLHVPLAATINSIHCSSNQTILHLSNGDILTRGLFNGNQHTNFVKIATGIREISTSVSSDNILLLPYENDVFFYSGINERGEIPGISYPTSTIGFLIVNMNRSIRGVLLGDSFSIVEYNNCNVVYPDNSECLLKQYRIIQSSMAIHYCICVVEIYPDISFYYPLISNTALCDIIILTT